MRRSMMATTAVAAMCALVLAACSTDLDTGTEQTGDATEPGALVVNADGSNDQFTGVAMLRGASACTGFLVDTGMPTAPATVLTNGHCAGIFDSTTVMVDDTSVTTSVTFNAFVDTQQQAITLEAPAVRWATMRGTDLAVLELDETLADLQAKGVRAYRLAPPAAKGAPITVVGVPVSGVNSEEVFLRRVDCRVLGDATRLLEWRWIWDAAQPNSCRGILGGNSGSPVFDAAGDVVGIINTTTIGAPLGGDCDLGRPCEIGPDGPVQQADTSYAQPVDGVLDCLVDGRFTLGGACPFEPGDPVGAVQAQLYGRSPWTWSAEVVAPTFDQVVVKVGPIATTDCRSADGYGAPQAPALFDGPMPDADGAEVLCVAGVGADGQPVLGGAGFALAVTDNVPPTAPIELAINGDPEVGYLVEPIFNTPDLGDFLFSFGPEGTVDCADESAYVQYRRVPVTFNPEDLPATMCVIGFDYARNRTEPVEFTVP